MREMSEDSDGGVLVHLQYLNEKHTYRPVQILGMLFANLKQMAEKNLETSISSCVIGIPSYITELQRRAYLDVAHIADLEEIVVIIEEVKNDKLKKIRKY